MSPTPAPRPSRRRLGLRPPSRRRRLRALVGVFGWSGWASVGSLITAVAAIGALVFTSGALQATQRQIELTEQGQLTDRFGKAVEQLGSDKLDVRLGGIYALERLARDSARDHPVVIEVLAAFVRDHAPATACTYKPGLGGLPDFAAVPATDVQAALTVIGRDAAHGELANGIDLGKTCLYGADLTGANLSDANFGGADLTDADLKDVKLAEAYLIGANITFATLSDADLSGAHLLEANLEHADLTGANLTGAWVIAANLTYADLEHAKLTGADLEHAKLINTNLTGADLTGANLEHAYLTGAIGVPASDPQGAAGRGH